MRSIAATADGLGEDGAAWRRLFGSPAHFDELLEDMLGPILHVPDTRFASHASRIPSAAPATVLARRWRTPQARALFGGVAAHLQSAQPADELRCRLRADRRGPPIRLGGRQGGPAIADALAAVLVEHGGAIETGRRVTSIDELPKSEIVVFDLVPSVAEIAGIDSPAGLPGLPPLPPRPGSLQARSGR